MINQLLVFEADLVLNSWGPAAWAASAASRKSVEGNKKPSSKERSAASTKAAFDASSKAGTKMVKDNLEVTGLSTFFRSSAHSKAASAHSKAAAEARKAGDYKQAKLHDRIAEAHKLVASKSVF